MPPISPFLRRRSISRPPTLLNEKFKWAALIHSRKVLCGSSRSGWRGGWMIETTRFFAGMLESALGRRVERMFARGKVADLPFAVFRGEKWEKTHFSSTFIFFPSSKLKYYSCDDGARWAAAGEIYHLLLHAAIETFLYTLLFRS